MKNYSVSREKWKESQKYLAGGVASSLRSAMKPAPLFVRSAQGARIYDVDGNEYIDYLLGYGPLLLGHAHPELNEAIYETMQKGLTYGLQHEGEIALAKRLTEILPCAEKVVFSGSGTEAVMLALRLARAHTEKRKIVRFHGHYHGWSDSIFTSFPSADMKQGSTSCGEGSILPGTSGQSELSLEDIILLPWNDITALENTLKEHHSDIAAVITEPIMCNSGCIRPLPGYLERMRGLTSQYGVVLIFDEVITGFRLGLGGAHGRFGILPDLMTMGKALAGGIALSAVAGKREIMDLVASGRVNHLGTLNGNCVSTAAALAMIQILSRSDGDVFKHMDKIAARISEGLRDLMKKHGFRGVVNQIGPVFHMMFINRDSVSTFQEFSERDSATYFAFAEKMLNEGVLVRSNGLWYVSAVHGDSEARNTLAAADRALASLATA